jgi:hypothetical protein
MSDPKARVSWPALAGIVAGAVGPLMLAIEVSYFEAYAIVFGYGLIAVCLVGLATGICRLVLRPAQFSRVIAFSKWCVLAIAMSSVSALLQRSGGVSGCSLEEDAIAVLSALDEYRAREGHYPSDLRQLGIEIPETPFGPWTYEADDSGFQLTVGDYMEHGFALEYRPDAGWYCDT